MRNKPRRTGERTLLVLGKGTSQHQEHQSDRSPEGQADQGCKENTNSRPLQRAAHNTRHGPSAQGGRRPAFSPRPRQAELPTGDREGGGWQGGRPRGEPTSPPGALAGSRRAAGPPRPRTDGREDGRTDGRMDGRPTPIPSRPDPTTAAPPGLPGAARPPSPAAVKASDRRRGPPGQPGGGGGGRGRRRAAVASGTAPPPPTFDAGHGTARPASRTGGGARAGKRNWQREGAASGKGGGERGKRRRQECPARSPRCSCHVTRAPRRAREGPTAAAPPPPRSAGSCRDITRSKRPFRFSPLRSAPLPRRPLALRATRAGRQGGPAVRMLFLRLRPFR